MVLVLVMIILSDCFGAVTFSALVQRAVKAKATGLLGVHFMKAFDWLIVLLDCAPVSRASNRTMASVLFTFIHATPSFDGAPSKIQNPKS
jgi:hypothetical protein